MHTSDDAARQSASDKGRLSLSQETLIAPAVRALRVSTLARTAGVRPLKRMCAQVVLLDLDWRPATDGQPTFSPSVQLVERLRAEVFGDVLAARTDGVQAVCRLDRSPIGAFKIFRRWHRLAAALAAINVFRQVDGHAQAS